MGIYFLSWLGGYSLQRRVILSTISFTSIHLQKNKSKDPSSQRILSVKVRQMGSSIPSLIFVPRENKLQYIEVHSETDINELEI